MSRTRALTASSADSAITLVEPAPAGAAGALLWLDETRERTVLRHYPDGTTPLYTAATARDGALELADAAGAPVARVRFRGLLPDQVALHGGQTRSLKAWLGDYRDFNYKRPVTFTAGGQRYVWLLDSRWIMALFPADGPVTESGFLATCVDADADARRPPRVWLGPDTDAVRDEVITSLLVLLRFARSARRVKEKEKEMVASLQRQMH